MKQKDSSSCLERAQPMRNGQLTKGHYLKLCIPPINSLFTITLPTPFPLFKSAVLSWLLAGEVPDPKLQFLADPE